MSVCIPLMTLPRVESDLLMAAPSCSLAPVAPVDSALSLWIKIIPGGGGGEGSTMPPESTARAIITAFHTKV